MADKIKIDFPVKGKKVTGAGGGTTAGAKTSGKQIEAKKPLKVKKPAAEGAAPKAKAKTTTKEGPGKGYSIGKTSAGMGLGSHGSHDMKKIGYYTSGKKIKIK